MLFCPYSCFSFENNPAVPQSILVCGTGRPLKLLNVIRGACEITGIKQNQMSDIQCLEKVFTSYCIIVFALQHGI